MSNYNRLGILDQIHLAGEDEDDLYSGYNEANPIFDNEDLADDPNFQKAVLQTSHGRRAPQTGMVPRDTFSRKPLGTATWGGRSNLSSSFGRPIRTGISPQDGSARPMTAVRGAGYTSAGNRGATFDSTDPVLKGISPVSPLEKRTDEKRNVTEMFVGSNICNVSVTPGLKFLTKISADLGLPDAQEYATKLKKAEKAKEMRDQRINSGRRGSGRHRDAREGSAGSERTGSGSSSRKSSGKVTQRMADRMGSGQRTGDVIEDGSSKSKEIDATYSDPLGPQAERPKTAARRREVEDEFADEEIEDLLPE
ncbi:Hypothetical predicted protein [Octopus vulgaris]|nr:Hypothetical predicted protein [Octopus vulgaris]